jgi:hypothetical protein
MTMADHVLLVLALGLSLMMLVLTLKCLRQISAQMAVLTLRMIDLVEAIKELDTDLRAELDRFL